MVLGVGLEPTRPFGHSHLKRARLPIPPPEQRGEKIQRNFQASRERKKQNIQRCRTFVGGQTLLGCVFACFFALNGHFA
jgi:hypothetical protein